MATAEPFSSKNLSKSAHAIPNYGPCITSETLIRPSAENQSSSSPKFIVCQNLAPQTLSYIYPINLISCLKLEQTEGRGIGYHQGYTTLKVFSLLTPEVNQFIPLLDIRLHHFDNNKYACNMGLGARYFYSSLDMAFGANLYYDYRQTNHTTFNQIGLGFEILDPFWSLRLNAYLPLGHKECYRSKVVFDDFEGDHAIIRKKYEVALKSIDIDLEAFLYRWEDFCFYSSIGAYYLRTKFYPSQALGGQFRLTLIYNEYVNLEAVITHDTIFKTRAQVQVGFSIPFDYQLNQACEDCFSFIKGLMTRPIKRRDIIATNKHDRWWWNFHSQPEDCSH